jgi:glycogen debranching enzyme
MTQELSSVPSVGGILAAFAPINAKRAAQIADRIKSMKEYSNYAVASHDPKDVAYDGERYWRGPVWLIVNYMIANGLARAGQSDVANIIEKDSLTLIEKSGFAEYYDPITGAPCGGGQFTWTAAMVIEFIKQSKAVA